jgi:hypothetical protein
MKLRRREFIGFVGASVASMTTPSLSFSGSLSDVFDGIEKNGWRLRITPAGDMVSLTDGNWGSGSV